MGNNQTLIANSSYNHDSRVFHKIPWNTISECVTEDDCIGFRFLLTKESCSCHVIDNNKHSIGGDYSCYVDNNDRSKVIFKNDSKNELVMMYSEDLDEFTILTVKRDKGCITFSYLGYITCTTNVQ